MALVTSIPRATSARMRARLTARLTESSSKYNESATLSSARLSQTLLPIGFPKSQLETEYFALSNLHSYDVLCTRDDKMSHAWHRRHAFNPLPVQRP